MNSRLRQCLVGGHDGKPKAAFRTMAEANQWIAVSKLRAVMRGYWCRHCYNYHVGHMRRKRAK